jgi:hypothetical protein
MTGQAIGRGWTTKAMLKSEGPPDPSLTWVRLLGPMALVSLVYIRVKADKDYGLRKKPTEGRLDYEN